MSASSAPEPRKALKYLPLNEEAQEIRLLILLPGKLDSGIQMCLKATPLTEDYVPEFEALSYAWGSADNPVDVSIKNSSALSTANSDFCKLSVTENLASALPFLRYEDRPRKLWIDAICVNQQDLDERSAQVKRMADVYSKATRVVIWLGRESQDSLIAMDCMQEAAANAKVDTRTLAITATSIEKHWEDPVRPLPFEDRQFLALLDFLKRPWFERLWIWQELWLASSAVVMCGPRTISWDAIQSTVNLLSSKSFPTSELYDAFDQNMRLTMVYNLCHVKPGNRLYILIGFTKESLCTDPRDRIFALLSIAEQLGIQPDYKKTVAEVYQDAVLQLINKTNSLQILRMVEAFPGPSELPSWVPNLSIRRITNPLVNNFASGASRSAAVHENHILRVVGVTIGIVEDVEVFNITTSVSVKEIRNELADAISRLLSKKDIPGKEFALNDQQLRDLCLTICSGLFSDVFHPSLKGFPSYQRGQEILSEILQHRPTVAGTRISNDETRFLANVRHYCLNRSLFGTKEFIGLGPKSIQKGDIVAILLGCDSAMLLRPMNGSTSFRVVGEAYCSSYMRGEALLGPLPEGVEYVWRVDEDMKSIWFAIINRASGELQAEYPRLNNVSLPEGWSRRKHPKEECFTSFVNGETGEEMRSDEYDPRMTAEALRERGVKLETFDLV